MLQCDPRNRRRSTPARLKLQQRFTDGLQFLVSYTYGKSLDYGGSAASGGGAVGNGQTITDIDGVARTVGLRHAAPRASSATSTSCRWGPNAGG